MDNVVKECYEEAGIPPEITRQTIQPVGAISYENFGSGPIVNRQSPDEGVMNRVVLFCFDLTLPQDFVPKVNDGEVDSFFQWTLKDIAKSMDPQYDDPIKPNCYPGKEKFYIIWFCCACSAVVFERIDTHLCLTDMIPFYLLTIAVIIDYLLRSGAISPDSPKYLEILRTLRSGTCC